MAHNKGWRNNPTDPGGRRHGLSARGIKNAPSKSTAMKKSMELNGERKTKSVVRLADGKLYEESVGKNADGTNNYFYLPYKHEPSKKKYNVQKNIGTAKYVVNYWDGKKRYNDGSEFYDIAIFSNKKKLEAFEKELAEKGYREE